MNTQKVTAIHVENEMHSAKDFAIKLARTCPEVELVASIPDVAGAYDAILQHEPKILFLDIQLDGETSFDLLEKLEKLKKEWKLIFVTSYDEFAIQAFESTTIDYLLKPVDEERLAKAVAKAKTVINAEEELRKTRLLLENLRTDNIRDRKRVIPHGKNGRVIISLKHIVYIKGDHGCATIFMVDGKRFLYARTLMDFERGLPGKQFYRTHQSYIVNIEYVAEVLPSHVRLSNGELILLAKRKRSGLLDLIDPF